MPEHTVQALIMRVTPQANITDGTGTTVPAKSAAQALKVLARTARLQGGTITVKQRGYDLADPAAGTVVAIDREGRVTEHEKPGAGPCWDVSYHSWVIDVELEGSYSVPGLPTALGDARMLATKHDRAVIVHVEDIKPSTSADAHIRIEPEEPATPESTTTHQTPDPVEPETETAQRDTSDRDASERDHAAEAHPSKDSVQDQGFTPAPSPEPDPAVVPGEPLVDVGAVRLDVVAGEQSAQPARQTTRRRRALLVVLMASVLLAGGTTAAVSTVMDSAAPKDAPSAAAPAPALWQTAAVPGETALAAHGVLVNTAPGKIEVFSLTDGKSLGGGVLPEGRARVISGAGAVFAVVTSADGTNTGYVASTEGVKDFKAVKGTLVTRGSEPFLLTGSGKDQAALVWGSTGWKPVAAPEAGMAPVAASKAGVMWLGTNGRLASGGKSASLQKPESATKISAWVTADETSVAVVWDTPQGKVLAVHASADGKITGQVPVPDGEVRKDGEVLHAGTQAFTIVSGVPVAAACADPVPAGGRLWCSTDKTWAAGNDRPLAPGHTPVPSPEDVVITATDTGFTAYPEDTNNN